MNVGLKIAAVVLALALLYFGAVYVVTDEAGAPDVTLAGLIAAYAARYMVDPRAVATILHNEGGQWVAEDDGSSFGPLQVHKGGLSETYPNPGAVDAWEQVNGSVADSSGAYDYLATSALAVQIGVWYIAQVLSQNGGPSVAGFAAYNGSGSAAQTYGQTAFAYYQSLA